MGGYIFLELEWVQDYWLRAFLTGLFYGLPRAWLALSSNYHQHEIFNHEIFNLAISVYL